MGDQRTSIRDVAQLEEMLSEPREGAIRTLGKLSGDVLILGVGGKMGPTLARMAMKAFELGGARRRVTGISRFSSPSLKRQLEAWGIKTVGCDLLDPALAASLPDAAGVIFMAGMKFGSTGQEWLTWATNSFLPWLIPPRSPGRRIHVFST